MSCKRDHIQFCTYCANEEKPRNVFESHDSNLCPYFKDKKCLFCKEKGHTDYICPTIKAYCYSPELVFSSDNPNYEEYVKEHNHAIKVFKLPEVIKEQKELDDAKKYVKK